MSFNFMQLFSFDFRYKISINSSLGESLFILRELFKSSGAVWSIPFFSPQVRLQIFFGGSDNLFYLRKSSDIYYVIENYGNV